LSEEVRDLPHELVHVAEKSEVNAAGELDEARAVRVHRLEHPRGHLR
jgi:hypothetical protein